MSKRINQFLIMLLIVLLFPFPTALAGERDNDVKAAFVLPSSLQLIEDGAFSNIAAETVILPDGLLQIGENALDGVRSLTDIYIPDTTEYIADSAISCAQDITIHGTDNSYAKDWAERHGIPFVVDDIWHLFILKGMSEDTQTKPMYHYIGTIVLIILFSFFRSCYYELRSRRPQDRSELYPIEYRFP